jgi:hypothetical protein
MMYRNFTGNEVNLNQCLESTDYTYKWDYDIINYMRELEENYKCSGLCLPSSFLLFTSFQDGPPQVPCYTYIK